MTSVKAVLRKTKLTNDRFPISLRVTKNRRSKFFKTPYSVLEQEWNPSVGEFNKRNSNYIQNNRLLNKYKERAYSIITDIEIENEFYTLEDFENTFRNKKNPINQNIFNFGDQIVADMRASGRVGNGRAYYDTLNSLKRYRRNRHLTFKEINCAYLDKYETYLRSRGGNDSGIGVRMRAIRALFNMAIKHEYIPESLYPFKVYKISKLKAKGFKSALSLEEINRIVALDLTNHPRLCHFKKYFLFSFYTRGMNFADMTHLTWDDIQGDRILYTRSKTKVNFQIKIIKPVKEILDFYMEYPSDTNYIFPILLRENLTMKQIENRKHKVMKLYNSALKEIANLALIEKKVTTYVARHSFATCLKHKGVPTDIISESLGHQNIIITQTYLKSFNNSVLDDATEVLLS
jgi:integrase/recombinase XerD